MLITVLQRYSLWVFLVLSGLAGLALGNLYATYLSVANDPPPTVVSLKPEKRQKQSSTSLSDYGIITRHNIFSPSQRSQTPQAVATEQAVVANQSKWSLVGTVSGGDYPLATLEDRSETLTLGLGEALPDGGVLSKIERNLVEISYQTGKKVILVPEEGDDPPARPQARSRGNRSAAAPQASVDSLGDNRWVIPALVANDARENVGELLKQARAVPVLEDGRTTGFKIRMIRPRSLIAQLGLERGDILRQVNGLALDSPEKALQIFAQLRQAKQIQIDLERKGKHMTFAYEIR